MTGQLSPAGLQRLHQAMAARVDKSEMPGMVTLIAHGNQVHVDEIGLKDFGGTEPMRRQTPFRIASLTKPILAAATMMLVDEGTLHLEDPIDGWLPELASRRVLRNIDGPLDDTVPANRPITVDDLLTFRMGFGLVTEPSYEPPFPIVERGKELRLVLAEPDPRTPHAPDEWIARFGTLPLMHQPGERWKYNAGSLVLSVLLPRVSGQPLGDLFQTRIFDPLGMATTGFWLPGDVARSLPGSYMTNFQTGQMEKQTMSTPDEWSRPPAFPSGAGGLVSTAEDFLQFARLLLNRGVHKGTRRLSDRSVELMTTNHLTPEQMQTAGMLLAGQGWGFGMGVVTAPDSAWPVPGRYGWSGGYGTSWFNDPHRGIVAMALTQTGDFLWSGALDEFGQLVAGTVEP